MEGIFEALLQLIFELVLEAVGEVLGAAFEYVISSSFADFINNKLPILPSSQEITTLNLLEHNKENFIK